jgi:serine/threonine protein phosphatase PrpC
VNPNEILKGPLVIATPEITMIELTGEEEFILLASDGLYDVLNDQEAIDFLRKKMKELKDVQRAVDAMVEYAIVQQRSMDNVTALVIMLTDLDKLT